MQKPKTILFILHDNELTTNQFLILIKSHLIHLFAALLEFFQKCMI